ncbi:T6SS phospholipase effector Tle1-like catalytic domain-containing protein [Stenotrophomonas maltophilia]|uniref:T6SS phospholipase effector Tle1-like catalytic domain-containing protein n=1 Tax=Stenotrophomonas maltophilia TaxID=40324 RepID=UPI001EF770DA|nr:DUF2235 domain-containing protein [Stenotrophomonas maltophilia]
MNGRTATGAQPMPGSGRRALSGAEAQRRARAIACLRQKGSECQGQVHVSIYFDGTGNNREWAGTFVSGKTRARQTQLARNGHSNVARLYDASLAEPGNGFFSVYVPGVGTPFPEVGDTNQDGDTLGGGAARYGADRIHWAILQVFNSIHRYLGDADLLNEDEAKTLVRAMSQARLLEGVVRRTLLHGIAQRLERVVKGHQRRVRSVHVSVFGFSRGAAQARAFVHRLYETAEALGGGCVYNIAGIPLHLNFMGIFDTVASVGIAAMSRVSKGKWDWASGNMMSIHPEARQCVHFAALHEQRINFPLDLATSGKEVLYPGMHSDVGGGYTPGGQGKDFVSGAAEGTAKLSQIPLIDMHFEALKAGVMIRTIDEMGSVPMLTLHFGCHAQLIRDYNAWLTGHGVPAGAHTQQIAAHCRHYVAWKGKRMSNGPQSVLQQSFYRQADDEDKVDLANALRDFAKLVAELRNGKNDTAAHLKLMDESQKRVEAGRRAGRPVFESMPRASAAAYTYAGIPAETSTLLDLVLDGAPVPDVSTTLFDNYVHDSLAGFYMSTWTELNIPRLNTYGYLRYREVFSVTGRRTKECRDPDTLTPADARSIGVAGNSGLEGMV